MEKEIINFRGFKKVYMVTILEGKGVEGSPYEEVRYIFDDEADRFLGIVKYKDINPPTKDTNGGGK